MVLAESIVASPARRYTVGPPVGGDVAGDGGPHHGGPPLRYTPLDVRAVLPEIVESTMVVGPMPKMPAPAGSKPNSVLSSTATWSRVMAPSE